ncbi:MAG: S-adenosylmethionine:tRNA ribosyltransferase-isomerase, partial [Bacteroidia bacterium]|nr:S-adenosylmethionine:tRNA ribosyltransferase-isomerase [Bacteroidia bacterium]
KLSDYNYFLPQEKIAQNPLDERDTSRLLFYAGEKISHHIFSEINNLIPAGTTLFFNDTKVIPARIIMKRNSGAAIEIFLLQPHKSDYASSLSELHSSTWKCLIGNKKKWKNDEVLTCVLNPENENITLLAKLTDSENNTVEFSWDKAEPFANILEIAGSMPIPPYIKRNAENSDKTQYQTVYAQYEGAVAAPTAGLHFTDSVLEKLQENNCRIEKVTLHVGAGTFLPVTDDKVVNHNMHTETFILKKETVTALLESKGRAFCVGTTSLRVIESLYYIGTNLLSKNPNPFLVEKLSPYNENNTSNETKALEAVLDYFNTNNLTEIEARTGIMILPGYKFHFVKGLITNFHMPSTTLILLVAAFIGSDWKKIYNEALNNNYRFLSYGDSSLLIP